MDCKDDEEVDKLIQDILVERNWYQTMKEISEKIEKNISEVVNIEIEHEELGF